MLSSLAQQWRDLTKIEPGKRFQNRYQGRKNRRRSAFLKIFFLMLGAALFLVGIALIPAPGPGVLVMFIGASMMAEESLFVARALDRTEVLLRRLVVRIGRGWKRASPQTKASVAVFALSVVSVAGVVAYGAFFA
jgi:uncharacterized protein (TIGR02611 family)